MISTHILDTTLGTPADKVRVLLEKESPTGWATLSSEFTNADGRIVFQNPPEAGSYRLTFFIEDYFKRDSRECFFLNVPVPFKITNTQRKYHVPLLLNPYGFSTYRGS